MPDTFFLGEQPYEILDSTTDFCNLACWKIRDEQRCEEFVIFTSVDGWGKQAEYGRNGLEFDRWWKNVRKILSKCPTVSIGLMSTYNALSVFSFPKLIKEVYELKKEFASTDRDWVSSVFLDASYLRYPTHQTIQVLGGEFADLVKKQGDYDVKSLGFNYRMPDFQAALGYKLILQYK